MFCRRCGKEIKTPSKFCPKCGAKLGGDSFTKVADDNIVNEYKAAENNFTEKLKKKPNEKHDKEKYSGAKTLQPNFLGSILPSAFTSCMIGQGKFHKLPLPQFHQL